VRKQPSDAEQGYDANSTDRRESDKESLHVRA
jgi:hypothetical protein